MERVVAFVDVPQSLQMVSSSARPQGGPIEETSVLGHQTVQCGNIAGIYVAAGDRAELPNRQRQMPEIEPACSSAIQLMPAPHED